MTFSEIIKQALNHLEYGDMDDQTAAFFDRFMMYANDAVRIIADDIKPTKVDTVQLVDGKFSLSDLSKPLVTKVCEVFIGRRAYQFFTGDELGDFVVSQVAPDATVSVRYRWMPVPETDGDKEPDIPEIFHSILWLYIVYCHNNSRSSGVTGYSSQTWLAEFERQRKILKRSYGAFDSYMIRNKPWQTREM